jgi:hypothetical protein
MSPMTGSRTQPHKQRETAMADGGGGNALLSLVFGGLIVFVAVLLVFGWSGKSGDKVAIDLPTISAPR